MRGLYTAGMRSFTVTAALVALAACGASATQKQTVPALRWAENATNCTFRDADDGRTYYGLSSGDIEITLAVDRQELEKIPHRAKPMLGDFLTFHYKGNDKFEVLQNKMYLEYTKHSQVVKGSLDPDDMLKHLQENVDDLTDEVERHDVKKHPELKEQKESELQQRLKDYTEMMDFISTRALKPVTLDASNSSASGWVFFSIKDKWIGPWRKPEEFVLRFPVENYVVEFPFSLPPKGAKVEFRKRPGE
jgi:hypothetical protein